MAIYGDHVAIDGGEIIIAALIDGGEISSTTYVTPNLQNKTVTPSEIVQIIAADLGYNGLHNVIVEAIPTNYGRITYHGNIITVS